MDATDDSRLFRVLAEEQRHGRPVVMATLIARRGSVPREVGARMLLWPNGAIMGSVGGGCAEAEVCVAARRILLETRRSETINIKLTDPESGGTGDVCGGQMDVFLDYIDAGVSDARG